MFSLKQSLFSPEVRSFVLDNGITVNLGDLVSFSTQVAGVVSNDNADVVGKRVLGILVGVVKRNGEVVSGIEYPFTTPSTNTSTEQYQAQVLMLHQGDVVEGNFDADLGTTDGSDKPGVYFDLVDAGRVAENSAALPEATGTPKQFLSLGKTDTRKALLKVVKVIGEF